MKIGVFKRRETVPEHPPIWPGTEIPVLGVSGEYQSGKTLFVSSIDPKHTLLFDFEKSAAAYSSLPLQRIDCPSLLLEKFPNGYKPIDAFEWFVKSIRDIKPGLFTVIAVDPISDIEAGLVDWVNSNPEEFGRTSSQYQKSGGILWGDVKNHWKLILADLASRCQTFAFTSHMRAVWGGNKPTGEREPKGKDTLRELATLYMVLQRIPDKKTRRLPQEPAGLVLKERLGLAMWDEKAGAVTVQPRLPQRIPVCTPATIRGYIEKPADLKKPKAGEIPDPPEPLTEEERLRLQSQIAEDTRAAEEIKAGRLDDIKKAAKKAVARKAAQTPKTDEEKAAEAAGKEKVKAARAQDGPQEEPAGDISEGTGEIIPPASAKSSEPQSSPPAAAQDAQEQPNATDSSSSPEPAPDVGESSGKAPPFKTDAPSPDSPVAAEMVTKITEQMDDIGLTPAQRMKALQRRGVKAIEELTAKQAAELNGALWDLLTKRDMQRDHDKAQAKKA